MRRLPHARRLTRVLISAYACEPQRGSEPGVGWHWAVEAAHHHDVWVLTRSVFRDAIERETARRPVPGLRFVYFDLPRWTPFSAPGGPYERFYYVMWQAGVLALARRLHRQLRFDVVHHLTFNSVDVPGLLWSLGPPFIWGPVGGGQVPPPSLKRYFGRLWLFEVLRALRKRLVPFNPLVRAAVRHASVVLAANADTERLVARLGSGRTLRELEAGIALNGAPPFGMLRTPPPAADDRTFTILWAGLLSPRKGPLLALDAFRTLRQRGVRARLLVAGDGPLRRHLEQAVRRHGLAADVALLGALPYSEMPAFYRQGHAFLFTSLQDTSGNVLLEAMAHRLPIVTLDHHGAAEIVSEACGVKVAVSDAAATVAGLANGLERLAGDPVARRRMGEAARQRVVARFAWERKGDLLREIYAGVTGGEGAAIRGGGA